jgi:uncharacterized protein
MANLSLRFYEELNDFLPPHKRKVCFRHSAPADASIKDIIESLGVPHTEIDLILVNNKSVDFSHQVQEGDYVSVYPVFESIDISEIIHLRPEPLRKMLFILDVHLGKLARYLRLLGFDVAYANNFSDDTIANRSQSENRIVLTRDIGLLKNKKISRGYWIRQTNPDKQVAEVLKRFDLYQQYKPFSRCLQCNGLLEDVKKNDIVNNLPPLTCDYYFKFMQCSQCKKIYWEGTHYQKLKKWVNKFIAMPIK